MIFHIAVLDREGTILDVNESWRRFACENDATTLDRLGTGINYLEVCRRSSDSGDAFAQTALEGIQSVLKPDAVVLDVMLPHVDGFDIVRELRADRHP